MQRAETVVQCDFDDTVTVGDVSYLLLDAFASGDWTPALDEYRERRITVSEFNARVFSLVTAGERAMLDHLDGRVTVRDGLGDLVDACRRLDFRLVIVSNGLKFYIDRILARLGISGIEVQAAQTCFLPEGLQVAYVAPDGARPEAGLKDYHVGTCLETGKRVIYIGDGRSDFVPARRCHHIFARSQLLELCRREEVDCVPFEDFHDVIPVLETLRDTP
jgi:2-hydroxy-3-keto-5-methylthiopentenyl-1-phosphate phosphatase